MPRIVAVWSLIAALWSAAPAWADKAPGAPPPSTTVPLLMKYDRVKTHKIILPKKFLEGVKLGQLELEQGDGEVALTGDRGRTVMAGLAFSLAIGSVVVFRHRKLPLAALLVAGAAAAGAGSLSWADVPVEPTKSKVILEIAETGDAIWFIQPNGR